MNTDVSRKLSEGFQAAKRITIHYAKTFYFASHFLDREKRYAAYSIYAVCRISDNAVDDTDSCDGPGRLQRVEKNIKAAYSNQVLHDKILLAFRETINTYQIPEQYFDDLIQGMHLDLNKKRYDDFNELYDYCYKVAGVVGLIMLKIFGQTSKEANDYAVCLGIAMQLTNILRDIKEDYQRGRIYLAQDEMEKYGIAQNNIASEQIDEKFIHFMQFQIQRAKTYYEESSCGIPMIPNMRSRLVVCLMKEIYAGILTSIEKNNFDVFSRRARVCLFKKLLLTLKVLSKMEFLKKENIKQKSYPQQS